jgi:hypothetical protein
MPKKARQTKEEKRAAKAAKKNGGMVPEFDNPMAGSDDDEDVSKPGIASRSPAKSPGPKRASTIPRKAPAANAAAPAQARPKRAAPPAGKPGPVDKKDLRKPAVCGCTTVAVT